MIAQANATITAVAGGGASEDFRNDAGASPTKWEGEAGAYYTERRTQRQTAEGLDVVIERRLIVETRNPSVVYAEGDDVVWTPEGEAARTDEIREIIRRRFAPAAAYGVETTVLVLEQR